MCQGSSPCRGTRPYPLTDRLDKAVLPPSLSQRNWSSLANGRCEALREMSIEEPTLRDFGVTPERLDARVMPQEGEMPLAECVYPGCGAQMHPMLRRCPVCTGLQFGLCLLCSRAQRLNVLADDGLCPACEGVADADLERMSLGEVEFEREQGTLSHTSIGKPNPRDFGVTEAEYIIYTSGKLDKRLSERIEWFSAAVVLLFIFSVIWVVTGELPTALLWTLLAVFPPMVFLTCPVIISVGTLTEKPIRKFRKRRLLKSTVSSRIILYEEAEAAYQVAQQEAARVEREAEQARQEAERARRDAERARLEAERVQRMKAREHWMSLGGVEFERELGTLFRHLGYRVEWTPGSGDQGVDLVLRRDGKTIVVSM